MWCTADLFSCFRSLQGPDDGYYAEAANECDWCSWYARWTTSYTGRWQAPGCLRMQIILQRDVPCWGCAKWQSSRAVGALNWMLTLGVDWVPRGGQLAIAATAGGDELCKKGGPLRGERGSRVKAIKPEKLLCTWPAEREGRWVVDVFLYFFSYKFQQQRCLMPFLSWCPLQPKLSTPNQKTFPSHWRFQPVSMPKPLLSMQKRGCHHGLLLTGEGPFSSGFPSQSRWLALFWAFWISQHNASFRWTGQRSPSNREGGGRQHREITKQQGPPFRTRGASAECFGLLSQGDCCSIVSPQSSLDCRRAAVKSIASPMILSRVHYRHRGSGEQRRKSRKSESRLPFSQLS